MGNRTAAHHTDDCKPKTAVNEGAEAVVREGPPRDVRPHVERSPRRWSPMANSKKRQCCDRRLRAVSARRRFAAGAVRHTRRPCRTARRHSGMPAIRAPSKLLDRSSGRRRTDMAWQRPRERTVSAALRRRAVRPRHVIGKRPERAAGLRAAAMLFRKGRRPGDRRRAD
jgi:hypothetical protein